MTVQDNMQVDPVTITEMRRALIDAFLSIINGLRSPGDVGSAPISAATDADNTTE